MSGEKVITGFHWTTQLQGLIVAGFPTGMLLYNNIHSWSYYRHKFLKDAGEPSEELEKLLETELIDASERRLRPLKRTKLMLCSTEEMESKTNGSFTYESGPLFRLSRRLGVTSSEGLRKEYTDLAALLGRRKGSINIESNQVPDAELKKALLTPRATKFAIRREVIIGDSPSELGIPSLIWIVCFTSAFPLVRRLRHFTNGTLALLASAIVSLALFYPAAYFFAKYRVYHFDKKVFKINREYALGARKYLRASMELGKIMYNRAPNAELKKLIAPNGDLLFHKVRYSERLERVNAYLKRLKEIKKLELEL